MEGIDKEYGAAWVDTFSAAFRAGDSATTSEMLSDLSGGGRLVAAFHTDTCEFLDEIVNGLHRLNVAVPANVTAAHGIYKSLVTERAPLTRRAKLFIIGGAVVAAAAYVYHRRRLAAQRAEDLEAVKSLLAGDSAVSLEEVTPQRRTPQSRPSAKERSKVMDRNKKLMARSRAAEQARDAAAADASRARADNDRLRAENARLTSNATAADERDAARTENERLRTEVARLSANARTRDEEALRILSLERDTLLVEKADLENKFRSHQWDVTRHKMEKTRARSEVAACNVQMERLRAQVERLRADKASLVDQARALAAERDSLRAERDALEESARLVPAPSAGDLAALSDEALAAFSAEAAALSHKLVSEDARRAAIATTSTNECVVCHERPLEVAFGCGHFCTCVECGISAKLSKCPICRAPVTDRRRIFAS
jgi:hypothetical protein